MTAVETFVDKFNKNESLHISSSEDFQNFENKFQIKLPLEYRNLLLDWGDVFSPEILTLIVDKGSDLNDIQEFWTIERIEYDKENEWTSTLEGDLIPFASDCMGNLFCFKIEELKQSENKAGIYFYDHDFDSINKIEDSFIDFISRYNKLK